MPFEKTVPFDLSKLEPCTLQTFTEVEIALVMPLLESLTPHQIRDKKTHALRNLFQCLAPHKQTQEHMEEWLQATLTHHFLVPAPFLFTNYLKCHNVSYKKIIQMMRISPNELSRIKFDIPYHLPNYESWDAQMVFNWEQIKTRLNLFQQPTFSNPNNKLINLKNF